MLDHTAGVSRLIDQYLALSESAENQRRLALWEPELCARDQWHGRPIEGEFRRSGAAPLTIDLQNPFWLQLFPTDIAATYSDPAAHLRFYLQRRIYAFENIPDDTPLDGRVQIFMGTPFEPSFFGVPVQYFPDRDALIDQQPVVTSDADLDRLEEIDSFTTGMMPQTIRLYEGMVRLAEGRLSIVFPEWLRGPFGLALYLRGYQDLLVDLVQRPEFAHRLLRIVNRARMDWFCARSAHLGEPLPPGSLFNDEVDAAVIGRRHYREHICSFEAELARFHGAISYWHSCGNTGPLASEVMAVGPIEMLDISGWTSLDEVLATTVSLPPRLEIRLHPVRELQHATATHMAEKVRSVLDTAHRADVGSLTLRVSGLQPWHSVDEDLAQVQLWLETARHVTEEMQG